MIFAFFWNDTFSILDNVLKGILSVYHLSSALLLISDDMLDNVLYDIAKEKYGRIGGGDI